MNWHMSLGFGNNPATLRMSLCAIVVASTDYSKEGVESQFSVCLLILSGAGAPVLRCKLSPETGRQPDSLAQFAVRGFAVGYPM